MGKNGEHKMSIPNKHHYVPQAYLKFFSKENEKGEYIICVIDKISKKEFFANVTNIAEKRNFNKIDNNRFIIPTPNGDPLFYEYKYTYLIEGKIPQIIRNITAACTLCNATIPILTEKIKKDLAKMIVVQLLRTPKARKYSYDIGSPIYYNLTSNIRTQIETMEDTKRKIKFSNALNDFKYTEEFVNSVHLQATTDEDRIDRFVKYLVQNRSWVVYENKYYKSIPFVTSDNPVVMYDMKSSKLGFGMNGLDNKTTIISMPLTPKYMISLYHKEYIFGYYSQSYENKCIEINEKNFIINQNLFQHNQCTRQIYTTPETDST